MAEMLNDKIARLMWRAQNDGENYEWEEVRDMVDIVRMRKMALRILEALGIRPAGEGGFVKTCPLCEDSFRVAALELEIDTPALDAPAAG